MAAYDQVASRLGQDNESGSATALFLTIFAGETLATFAQKVVTMDKHKVRTILQGSQAQFPVFGRASASLHTPGALITGGAIAHSQKVISIDGLLLSSVFIAKIDEAMNHYEVRSEYSTKMAEALAVQYDKHVLQMGVLAARASATITGLNGGASVVSANSKVDSAALAAAMFACSQNFDEKDVPEDGRYFYTKPAQYYLLAQDVNQINRQWGGLGAYSDGKVVRIGGLELVKTNNLPVTDVTDPVATKYNVDASAVAGLAMHGDAVGTVKLLDLMAEAEWMIEYQGTLLVAKYAMGHGILRPEAAAEVVTA